MAGAPDDAMLREIFTRTTTIAVVGASADPHRPSFRVTRFLRRCGYRVFAVNPLLASDALDGIPAVATLADVPEPVDLVDIFRRAELVSAVVDEALALQPLPQTIWMQLGLRDESAAARARARGVAVVMDRCPAIERPRLFGHP